MALTDSQRRANNKYIAANMTVLGCKIKKTDADAFRAACADRGTTPNAIFRAAIDAFMSDAEYIPDDAAAPDPTITI